MDFKKTLIILIFYIFSFDCKSEVRIDITEGNVDPIPIAILDFQNNSLEMNSLGKKISGVIRNNLERTGLFSNLRKETFITEKVNFNRKPDFSDWRVTTAQGLIHGRIIELDNKNL